MIRHRKRKGEPPLPFYQFKFNKPKPPRAYLKCIDALERCKPNEYIIVDCPLTDPTSAGATLRHIAFGRGFAISVRHDFDNNQVYIRKE